MDTIKEHYSYLLYEAEVVADTGGANAMNGGKPGLVNTAASAQTTGQTNTTGTKSATPVKATTSTDTLDGNGQETPGADKNKPTKTEIIIANFFNNVKPMAGKIDSLISDAIKEAESENGIKGARGFAGIAGAPWIVLRRSIFYATLMYILLRFINKTGSEGMKASVASAENKIKNIKGKSSEQRDKEKKLKADAKAAATTNEGIEYVESLADIGNLLKTVLQRVPTKGVNKIGTYKYFVKDIATAYGVIIGLKDGLRYCKSTIGSGDNQVLRYYDAANLTQTMNVTLTYVKNMAAGKAPNPKWDQFSDEVISKTLQSSAFQLNYGDLSRVVTEMSKQMFLLAYEKEDVNVNTANEKVQNALSNVTGIRPKGTESKPLKRTSSDRLE